MFLNATFKICWNTSVFPSERKGRMPFDLAKARNTLLAEAAATSEESVDINWVRDIEALSALCELAGIRTHIAYLGTAILAKATDVATDVYSVKASKVAGVYSARTLCHKVLVPLAPQIEIHLGVTGREPLNNQPYFRIEKFGDGTRIHSQAKPIVAKLADILEKLSTLSQEEARKALRSFILVRRRFQPRYAPLPGTLNISQTNLKNCLKEFLLEKSDGGKRAQAVVSALLDNISSAERVLSGRVNDPSRHFPGDVGVRLEDDSGWERVFEVRDKKVITEDVLIFAQRCLSLGVKEIAIAALAKGQQELDLDAIQSWSDKNRVGIRIYTDIGTLLEEALFWGPEPSSDAASKVAYRVHDRLTMIEAPESTIESWRNRMKPYG
jgi:hypothetical protein